MRFNLKKPCKNCPFSKNCLKGWLGHERASDIIKGVLHEDKTFTCHETLDKNKPDQSHCFGALVLLEKSGNGNNMLRIAERLQLYIPITKTRHYDSVFENKDDMVQHHS